jgi:tRNA(Ile)-lysidine synthase
MSKNLIKKFQNISHQYDLWKKGDGIVVACSGGPDSACLLDIFAKLAPKYNLKLIVAHVNYRLRGKDSDKDAIFVAKLASRYKLKLVVFKPKYLTRPDVYRDTLSLKKERGKRKLPSESQLRKIRYEFFEKVRRENKFDLIAVGHTLDDQVETFLMRIIRGAGLAGMAAMKHKSVYPVKSAKSGPAKREFNEANIIRPLLSVTREEVLDYLKCNKLKYRVDKTNKEISFLRNKVRHKLIPYLEKNFNPSVKKTLSGAISSVADDYNFLLEESLKAYQKNKNLNVKKLLSLHPAVLRGTLRLALAKKVPICGILSFLILKKSLKSLKAIKASAKP